MTEISLQHIYFKRLQTNSLTFSMLRFHFLLTFYAFLPPLTSQLSCPFMSKSFFRFKENYGNRHFTEMPTYLLWALIVFIKNNKGLTKYNFVSISTFLVLSKQKACFLYLFCIYSSFLLCPKIIILAQEKNIATHKEKTASYTV